MTPALDIECLNAATILDTLPDGAYITDTDRKIVFWNRAAEAITEWPRDEVTGRHCRDNILVHEDKDGHPLCGQEYCPLYRAIITGESVNVGRLVFAQSKSGRRVAVEVTVSPLRDGRGTVIGGIEVFRDLSPMMEDLKRARAIQQSELALELPGDARVRVAVKSSPVDLVGGDFHRVEALEGGRYSLMVADVTGHGVASALYSMQIRSLWDGGRPWLDRPGELLSFMNRRLCGLAGETGEYFATAVALCYDADTGRAHMACAGHPPPLLIRGAGRLDHFARGGPALGMVPEMEYGEQSAELRPGDTLLVFTDGAFEVPDGQGRDIGLEGFESIVQGLSFEDPNAALGGIEKELLARAGTPFLPDDLTLLALHRPEPGCG